jgi:hypothetical protein
MEDGLDSCSETSVRKYHSRLHKPQQNAIWYNCDYQQQYGISVIISSSNVA